MALVLCTGVNPGLLQTRRMILESAGHSVVTAKDERAMVAACREHNFDVAVIGQSTPVEWRKRVVSLIREMCPAAKILELYQMSTGRVLDGADSWLMVPTDVPENLSERVTALAENTENEVKSRK